MGMTDETGSPATDTADTAIEAAEDTLEGSVVVVTGAGRGIGAALARAFAAAGARVTLNDVDADAAEAVAREIGAFAVPGDAAGEDGIAALVRAARDRFGEIDVFCANAGVAPAGGPEASEAAWAQSWDVNVMAHVRASRELLPGWLERGRGRFIATVSAAGLLTMLGTAPYSVTKHAALAFAEWLSATYRHRGIHVHALCPQGVRTRMLDGSGAAGDLLLNPTAIEPTQVAQAVLEAVREDRFLILPHPEVAGYYAARAADPERWLGGMNKLQRTIEGAAPQA
jgi:NAD(P)-dependent dehydrogenase (short-subunit alcohol dehydrogenase family)